jgi:hypothetical protein
MFKVNKTRSQRYPCPVCGFPLKYPADDFNICPSCGVEFGYETAGRSFDELRREWTTTGARWASRVYPQPNGWNPWAQLLNAGFAYALPFHVELRLQHSDIFGGGVDFLPRNVMSVQLT